MDKQTAYMTEPHIDAVLGKIYDLLEHGQMSSARALLMNPLHANFKIGERVDKVGGDYRFQGHVVGAFEKRAGQIRYAVENQDQILHIYSEKNLVLCRESTSVRYCRCCGEPTTAPEH